MNCPPFPEIYVDDAYSLKRIAKFQQVRRLINNQVLARLGSKLPKRHSVRLSFFCFRDVLNTILVGNATGFRIYFAMYDDKSSVQVPYKLKNLLTLIFTGVKDNGDDIGIDDSNAKYCAITPNGDYFYGISKADAAKRVERYQEMILPVIRFGLGDGNTKSIVYDAKLTQSFIKEVQYQIDNNSSDVAGLKAYFSQYPDDDKRPDLRRRLQLDFSLTDDDGNDVLLEELPDFECRRDAHKAIHGIFILAYDTATPCPPGTQCGRTSVGNP